MEQEIKRGDIYLVELDDMTSQGVHLMKGNRPAVVIQNNIGNKHSPTVIVAVISASIRKSYPMHQKIQLDRESVIMYEQIFTLDKERLVRKLGELDDEERAICDEKLAFSLGVNILDLSNIEKIEVKSRRIIETKEEREVKIKLKVQFKDRELTLSVPLEEIESEFDIDSDTGLLHLEEVMDSIKGARFVGDRIKVYS
jgi:mRNA interferase MazF